MTLVQAIVLGAVQGVTEFLPIAQGVVILILIQFAGFRP